MLRFRPARNMKCITERIRGQHTDSLMSSSSSSTQQCQRSVDFKPPKNAALQDWTTRVCLIPFFSLHYCTSPIDNFEGSAVPCSWVERVYIGVSIFVVTRSQGHDFLLAANGAGPDYDTVAQVSAERACGCTSGGQWHRDCVRPPFFQTAIFTDRRHCHLIQFIHTAICPLKHCCTDHNHASHTHMYRRYCECIIWKGRWQSPVRVLVRQCQPSPGSQKPTDAHDYRTLWRGSRCVQQA